MPDKQTEANRRNALLSTGPTSEDGALACAGNATRHGLRALRPTIPGEDPAEWEAHRSAVLADLAPSGAVETALAEQVAAKLWRLGRVVRFEADLIANSQAEDELMHVHELSYQRESITPPTRADIPTRNDVASGRLAADNAARKLTERTEALGQLQGLAAMADDDPFPDWTLYEVLHEDFRPKKDAVEGLFKGEVMTPFLARHARALILLCCGDNGELDILQAGLSGIWSEKVKRLRKEAHNRQAAHENLARRYEEALERRRLASGLPEAEDLDRIQRYEAHLERGLHRDLDRLHQLKEARGAVPPRGPSVAVAVVQAQTEGKLGPFGTFHVEAAEITEEPAGTDGQGPPEVTGIIKRVAVGGNAPMIE
jgi:hypothetical protein